MNSPIASPAHRPNCREVPPGNGYCDRCAEGYPALCRYVLTVGVSKAIDEFVANRAALAALPETGFPSTAIVLTDAQWDHFMDTMTNPAPPTEAMKRAAGLMDRLRAERAAALPETPVQAQLGTGSGAGAQSDSGADSGHATSAVPCLLPSASEALRALTEEVRRVLPILVRAEDSGLWAELSAGTGVATMNGLARALGSARAALATVEAKEKTR